MIEFRLRAPLFQKSPASRGFFMPEIQAVTHLVHICDTLSDQTWLNLLFQPTNLR